MSATETAGAHLARLRVQYGDRYRVQRDGAAYLAVERSSGRRLAATTAPELEGKLIAQAEWGHPRE